MCVPTKFNLVFYSSVVSFCAYLCLLIFYFLLGVSGFCKCMIIECVQLLIRCFSNTSNRSTHKSNMYTAITSASISRHYPITGASKYQVILKSGVNGASSAHLDFMLAAISLFNCFIQTVPLIVGQAIYVTLHNLTYAEKKANYSLKKYILQYLHLAKCRFHFH